MLQPLENFLAPLLKAWFRLGYYRSKFMSGEAAAWLTLCLLGLLEMTGL